MEEKIKNLFSQIFEFYVKYSDGRELTCTKSIKEIEEKICKIESCNISEAHKLITYAKRKKLLTSKHLYSYYFEYRPSFRCGQLKGTFH